MKLQIDRYAYEAPGISIIPETEFEAAILSYHWGTATLTTGRADSASHSADGRAYGIKFLGPKKDGEK